MTKTDTDKILSAIIVVDKSIGMTSHDVVGLVRRKFKIKKVGHAGTLDPAATGVLVILLGRATKLSEKLSSDDKEYTAVIKLGERTDTGDAEGEIIDKRDLDISDSDIIRVITGFSGISMQTPPMFSAKKVKGKKLYDLARKGIEVERTPVEINIKKISITRLNIPEVEFSVICSKGTYIRQLADDIGEELGCGAHLTALRRTASGDFNISEAVSVEDIKKMSEKEFYENIKRIS